MRGKKIMVTTRPSADAARGALLGLAVGDALGAPLEWSSREEAITAVEAGLEMTGGRGWDPGEWTDDTAMALCLAECIANGGLPFDLDDLARRYAAWAASGPKDIGITTRKALIHVDSAEAARANSRSEHERTGRTAGNGTVMRATPLGLASAPQEQVLEAAREDARLTHWDPVASDASAALCGALMALRAGTDPVDAAVAQAGAHESLVGALELAKAGERDAVGELAGGPEGGTCWATLATGLCALGFESPAAGAALAYGVASALGGSGFIAAFTAGIVFRATLGRDPERLNQLTEEVGGVLSGVTFVLFGAILLEPALGELSWSLVLYAVLSLTIVRMLPVAIAMWGSRARVPTLGFLGWFGPRGLASIVFAVILIEESQLPEQETILLAVYLTVGLSIFAHGLTAAPLADRYARWYEAHPRDERPPMEAASAELTRTRGPTARHEPKEPGPAEPQRIR